MTKGQNRGNLFEGAQPPAMGETFETLLAHKNLVIERILSSAEIASSIDVQIQDEWVLLLRGEATLEVEDQAIALRAGDYLFLPAHTPHRVMDVSAGAIWLAIHLHGDLQNASA